MMKILLFLLVLLIPLSNAYPNDATLLNYEDLIYDHSEEETEDFDNLYIYKATPDIIKSLDTIVYYLSKDNYVDNQLTGSFKHFAEKLGLTNGAVFISLTEDVSGSNQSKNFDYLMLSTCDMKYFQSGAIVFENRKVKSCVRIPLREMKELLPILVMISKNIDKFDTIENKTNMIKLTNAVKLDLKSMGIPEENMEAAESILQILRDKYLALF